MGLGGWRRGERTWRPLRLVWDTVLASSGALKLDCSPRIA